MNTRGALALSILALFSTATAAQAAEPGSYRGKLYGYDKKDKRPYTNVTVKLTVAGSKVKKFSVSSAPLSCLNLSTGDFSVATQAIYVPSAAIKGGEFKRTYTVKKGGEEIGESKINGRFSGSTASGTVESSGSGCTGSFRFKVKKS